MLLKLKMKLIMVIVSLTAVSGLIPQAHQRSVATNHRQRVLPPLYLLGGDDEDRKPLTRDEEPDEYFASDFESLSTQEKLKDPLVIIGLVSIFFPFILLIFFNAMGFIGI
mmetsp:Transcript_6861/g.8222  ORF Transcript_6861/g.8222 Transcript_6861/m.8222 type:complete len:110 (+) Transcript_6861:18-347(+)